MMGRLLNRTRRGMMAGTWPVAWLVAWLGAVVVAWRWLRSDWLPQPPCLVGAEAQRRFR